MEHDRDDIKLAVMQNDVTYIKEKLNAIDTKVSSSYATKEELISRVKPLEKVVYGLIGLVLVAVVGAILGLVVIK